MPSSMQAPPWLQQQIAGLEGNPSLDGLADRLAPVAARAAEGNRGEVLRGRWLGHALHPLLTDFPLGCWLSANVLDLVGGRKSHRAAQRLVGLGLLAVPPTVASGLADWSTIEEEGPRRVGVVHAVGNLVVGLLYFLSWRSRRRNRHIRGAGWGLAGGVVALGTGYLGGHLSFARGVGVGQRGLEEAPDSGSPGLAAGEPDRLGALDPSGAQPGRASA
jgi:uncharacterized membrane protein